ncbi:hypothetical protein FNV43_RR17219 [Rhamnella rubrinervis]|uniref:Uncharacterized protein n=1 Tax=Rhamnella rubrinervis TaxID=2594499 RepID=A0A8K0E377_9ROSA|nr:hypothetical protein FNV43_RR17219 [Rhamnella rubrinervis]
MGHEKTEGYSDLQYGWRPCIMAGPIPYGMDRPFGASTIGGPCNNDWTKMAVRPKWKVLTAILQENTVVVIRFEGRFEVDGEGNWEYVGGRTKAKLIQTNCTYDELLQLAYDVTNINLNEFRIIIMYIVRSTYKLDPIEIENDGDMKCFFKEYCRVDTVHASPLFIEIEAKEDISIIGEEDNAFAIPFSSRSGSNKLSSSKHKVVVNRSGIRGSEKDEIP